MRTGPSAWRAIWSCIAPNANCVSLHSLDAPRTRRSYAFASATTASTMDRTFANFSSTGTPWVRHIRARRLEEALSHLSSAAGCGEGEFPLLSRYRLGARLRALVGHDDATLRANTGVRRPPRELPQGLPDLQCVQPANRVQRECAGDLDHVQDRDVRVLHAGDEGGEVDEGVVREVVHGDKDVVPLPRDRDERLDDRSRDLCNPLPPRPEV